jgi:epoxide hydrolase-like predicted phosphatase
LSGESSIRAVIWDMGGVLVRTESQAPRERLAQRLGLTPRELASLVFDTEVSIQATIGDVAEEAVWQNVAETCNLDANGLTAFMQEFWGGDSLDADLYQFVHDLHAKYKVGLLSNAWSGARLVLSSRYQMLGVFDVVIFSAEVGLAKPDPRIYQLALHRLGVAAAEAIFVDDVQVNVDAANRLGIHGVSFKNSLQARQAVMQILAEAS